MNIKINTVALQRQALDRSSQKVNLLTRDL